MEESFESEEDRIVRERPPCSRPFEVGNGGATASLVLGIQSFAGCTLLAAIAAIILSHMALSMALSKSVVEVCLLFVTLSFVGFFVFSAIPSIILGHTALSKIRKSRVPMKDRRLAFAGLVLGYANVIVVAAFVILILLHHRILTNEEAAIGHLRTIARAQQDYSYIHRTTTRKNIMGTKGYMILYLYPYAPDFVTLTKMHEEEEPPFRSRNWPDEDLPKEGVPMDGYVFKMELTDDSYHCEITASPAKPGRTGLRYFFSNTGGTIRANVGAPADSTSPLIDELY